MSSSQDVKQMLTEELCDNLTSDDMDKLISLIRSKVTSGVSPQDVGIQLVAATAETIYIAFPNMDASEIIDLAEEISDKLIDRVIEHAGLVLDDEVPHGQQLN
mgnify:CR=1 FL=1